ncbi:unnamed protein product [Prunus brigantina]
MKTERPRIFHFQFSSNSENSLSDQKRKQQRNSKSNWNDFSCSLARTRNSEKKKQQQQVCGSRIGKSEKKEAKVRKMLFFSAIRSILFMDNNFMDLQQKV